MPHPNEVSQAFTHQKWNSYSSISNISESSGSWNGETQVAA